MTSVSAGVKSVLSEESLRHSVWYRNEPMDPSRCTRGRIAPVVHHRRPHKILSRQTGSFQQPHFNSSSTLRISCVECLDERSVCGRIRRRWSPIAGWIAPTNNSGLTRRQWNEVQAADLIIADEFSYVTELQELWEGVLPPMLGTTRGRVMFCSTPAGGSNFAAEL